MNAPEFKLKLQYEQPMNFPQFLQHSKSSGNIQQQIQLAAAARRNVVQMTTLHSNQPILISYPLESPNSALSTDKVQKVRVLQVQNYIIIIY